MQTSEETQMQVSEATQKQTRVEVLGVAETGQGLRTKWGGNGPGCAKKSRDYMCTYTQNIQPAVSNYTTFTLTQALLVYSPKMTIFKCL